MNPRQSAKIATAHELLRENGIGWCHNLRNADPDFYHAVSEREAADVRDLCLPTSVSFRKAPREFRPGGGSGTLFSLMDPVEKMGDLWPNSERRELWRSSSPASQVSAAARLPHAASRLAYVSGFPFRSKAAASAAAF